MSLFGNKDYSNRWKCPHCGAIHTKAPEAEVLSMIGGRTSAPNVKCTACYREVETSKLINGVYDIR